MRSGSACRVCSSASSPSSATRSWWPVSASASTRTLMLAGVSSTMRIVSGIRRGIEGEGPGGAVRAVAGDELADGLHLEAVGEAGDGLREGREARVALRQALGVGAHADNIALARQLVDRVG